MKITLTHYYENGGIQYEEFDHANYFQIDDQRYCDNGVWLFIVLDEKSSKYSKHKEMKGHIWIEYEPGVDNVEIYND